MGEPVSYTGPRGNQDHQTPPDLLDAIQKRFGPLVLDLAASAPNVCPRYFSVTEDSLAQDWVAGGKGRRPGWLWLNPPFSGGIDIETGKRRNLGHWMKKCWEESRRGAQILVLVPYSADANWWRDWVLGKARSEALAPRVTFVGSKDPYPKTLALLVYEPGVLGTTGGHWTWK